VNELAQRAGDACYAFLAINFFLGLYHIIQTYRRLRRLAFRNDRQQQEFLAETMQQIQTGQYDAIVDQTVDDDRALPQLTRLAVENRRFSPDQQRQLVAEVLQRDIMGDLEYRTSWVATTIKSGPMLGLFGTVLGMMAAFGRIATGDKVTPAHIADEISIAFITTAMGLATAIPFNFLLASLNARIRRLQDSLASGLVRVLDLLRSRPH
jgi:biopolymer transport protein ExbB/TolQ